MSSSKRNKVKSQRGSVQVQAALLLFPVLLSIPAITSLSTNIEDRLVINSTGIARTMANAHGGSTESTQNLDPAADTEEKEAEGAKKGDTNAD